MIDLNAFSLMIKLNYTGYIKTYLAIKLFVKD